MSGSPSDHLPDSTNSSATERLSLDEGTQTWEALAIWMDRLIEAWDQSDQPPILADYLPIEPGPLRRLALVELIKIDLEYRSGLDDHHKRLEQYLEEFPELATDEGVPVDLIYEEYYLRRAAGETVKTTEYFDRFPQRQDELRRLLEIDAPAATTSLGRSGRIDVEVGQKLDDFHLIVELGKGAFGSVFLARQESMQRFVALKVTADEGSESQTLAQLDHPFIVRVFDQRILPDQGMSLMYLQYVPGGTLHAVIQKAKSERPGMPSCRTILEVMESEVRRAGQLVVIDETTRHRLEESTWSQIVCRWGAQLAEALDYAHGKGVLHRDIKPANVLLAADGTPKLADFNISHGSQVEGVTAASFFGGSLAYMSPEQLEAYDPRHFRRPDELDGRSDLYSLGLMLWELFCGQRAFADEVIPSDWGATMQAITDRRREGRIEKEAFITSDETTARLKTVLLKCLAPEREDRHVSGAELARDMQLCLAPRAARLMDPPRDSFRSLVLRFPLISIALAALIPNALAGLFNLFYNKEAIIDHLGGAQEAFWRILSVINAIEFPVGLVLVFVLIWPVIQRLKMSPSQRMKDPHPDTWVRRRVLRLGNLVAWLGVILWMIAAVAYPVSLHILTGDLGISEYAHFFASLLLCGLIAAAYPFFMLTSLAVQAFYPALLRGGEAHESDPLELELVARRSGNYLLVAGGVPALSITMLVLGSLITNQHSTMALLVLSLVGAAGFALAFKLYQTIQQDIEALRVVAAADASPGESGSWRAPSSGL